MSFDLADLKTKAHFSSIETSERANGGAKRNEEQRGSEQLNLLSFTEREMLINSI